MIQAEWLRVKEIFGTALNRPEAERGDFLDTACGDDHALRSEVAALLQSYEGSFLETPLLPELTHEGTELPLLTAGQTFSHFEIIRMLGRGGMGQVYLADDAKLARRVAIKILPAEFAEDHDRMSRFLLEAKFISALNHPNIVTIYEIGEDDGKHFIVTEFIDGETVSDHLKRESLPLESVLDIAIQIASALRSAHGAGIIHRDIKPANIMIRPDGVVKILDFGVAKLVEDRLEFPEDQTGDSGASSGMIIGTANYMSPEQARGHEIDERTDIFSFGIVLYEMLVGSKAFVGENAMDAIGAVLLTEPRALRELMPELPLAIEQIVTRSLKKNRDERYQTAKELLADLKDAKQSLDFQERTLTGGVTSTISSAEFATQRFKQHKLAYAIALTFLLLAITGSGYWLFARRAAGSAQINSIAVLPFENRSGNADTDYLSDGLADSTIFRLSRLPNLKVSPTSSVMRYKGNEVDVARIARDLNVDAVLSGRLVQQGDGLSISVQLIDTRSGMVIWAEQYDRKMSDLLTTQREIATAIMQKLQVKLAGNETRVISKQPTDSNEAYQLYLKGRFYFAKRTKDDILHSIDLYEQAIKFDPNFALAYAGMADSYVLLPSYAGYTPKEAFPQAKIAATTALSFDESLAEAHTALSYVLFNYDWDFAESEVQIRRAIELNPNYATAYHWYGNANLLALGRFDESIEALKKAQSIDPLSLIINADLATSYCYAMRLDDATAQYDQTLELDRNFYYAHVYLARAYLLKGDHQKALDELKLADGLSIDPRIPMLRARIFSQMGQKKSALRMLDELKRMAKERYVSNFDFAIVYAGLGDSDNAFASLERSFARHDGNLVYLKADPLLADLRSDPRFADLVKRMNFPR